MRDFTHQLKAKDKSDPQTTFTKADAKEIFPDETEFASLMNLFDFNPLASKAKEFEELIERRFLALKEHNLVDLGENIEKVLGQVEEMAEADKHIAQLEEDTLMYKEDEEKLAAQYQEETKKTQKIE